MSILSIPSLRDLEATTSDSLYWLRVSGQACSFSRFIVSEDVDDLFHPNVDEIKELYGFGNQASEIPYLKILSNAFDEADRLMIGIDPSEISKLSPYVVNINNRRFEKSTGNLLDVELAFTYQQQFSWATRPKSYFATLRRDKPVHIHKLYMVKPVSTSISSTKEAAKRILTTISSTNKPKNLATPQG